MVPNLKHLCYLWMMKNKFFPKSILIWCLIASYLFNVACSSSEASEEFCSLGTETVCETPQECGESFECGYVIVAANYTDTGELCDENDAANRTAIFEDVALDYDLEVTETYSCLNGAVLQVPEGQEEYWVEILNQDSRLESVEVNQLTFTD